MKYEILILAGSSRNFSRKINSTCPLPKKKQKAIRKNKTGVVSGTVFLTI